METYFQSFEMRPTVEGGAEAAGEAGQRERPHDATPETEEDSKVMPKAYVLFYYYI
jgi:hypothetical protein